MAPIAKETEPQNSPSPSPNSTQKVQPVALEIAVTVNGARSVDGTDKREPFSETTQTVLVFGNGAVIRLNSSVAPGQLLFLTNEKTKKEVVCQVVKSKNYRSVSGYVELEFTEPAVGFWGMRFPSDKIGTAQPSGTVAPPKPAPIAASSAPQSTKPVILPAPPVAPVAAAPPIAIAPPPIPSAPVSTAPVKVAPTAPPADNATEELKKQAARLQEQLSSMLFAEAPAPKDTEPPPTTPATISGATAKILEMSKAELPAAQEKLDPALGTKTFEPLNLTPIAPKPKSSGSLHEEEVKIPSWLEPLARNAATPAPPAPTQSAPQPPVSVTTPVALTDDLDAQVAGESYDFGAKSEAASEAVAVAEAQVPNFTSDLFANSEASAEQPAEGGSKKGIWIGAIAATILLAAGGGYWYLQQSGHASASTTTTTNASALSQPVSQPSTQQPSQTFAPASSSQNQTPLQSQTTSKPYTVPSPVSSQPSNPGNASVAPATEVQKIPANHEPAKPSPTSAASHAAEPVEDGRKSSFSNIRLATPTVKGSSNQNLSQAVTDPGIALENNAVSPISPALGGSHGSQPTAPIPLGGEVKQAVLISSVPPVYPQIARTQRVSGDVKIDALIDEHGRVTSTKVVSGPVMLYQAAQDALRQWKYRPATLNGQAVSMHLLVTIQFKLQ